MADGTKKVTRRRRIPPMDFSDCRDSTPEETLEFILGIKLDDWSLSGTKIGTYEGTKVSHFMLDFKGLPDVCPECGQRMVIHDYKERSWRHANLDDSVCYLHARIPRFQCSHCNKIGQAKIPWADPNVSYSKRFQEVALQNMAHMSLAATARIMMCSWSLLDDIVERQVNDYLNGMDLSGVKRIRIDETSAKKRHRYITIVTDADTDDVIFITKGKDSNTVREFSIWLQEHKGDPKNIELVSSDLGESFILGTKLFLPNAENVYDLFHVVQLGNAKLDKDRASNQINGDRKKSVRYALLKNPENMSEKEKEIVMDITHDNEVIGLSYEMNMSLRQGLSCDSPELAKDHLERWVSWVEEKGSRNFKALAKTVKKHLDGIVRAIETGINNGFQESLNGRVQFSKRLANGYHKEMRLGRIVYFRQSIQSNHDFRGIWC